MERRARRLKRVAVNPYRTVLAVAGLAAVWLFALSAIPSASAAAEDAPTLLRGDAFARESFASMSERPLRRRGSRGSYDGYRRQSSYGFLNLGGGVFDPSNQPGTGFYGTVTGGTEFGDAIARMRLYERFGARTLPVPYSQPALRPGSARVPHLLLMVFAADPRARLATGRVDGRVVSRFLTEYFASAEGSARPDDTELEAMLRACSEPGGLPLLLAEDLGDLG